MDVEIVYGHMGRKRRPKDRRNGLVIPIFKKDEKNVTNAGKSSSFHMLKKKLE